MKVAVFGLGYVGTVTAACLADSGNDVWGVDVDPLKVGMIAGGRSPVVEPGLDEIVVRAVRAGSLHATTDAREAVAGADVSLICVGTPSTPAGSTDLTYLSRAVSDIASALTLSPPSSSGHHSVVVRSTVPPGTVTGVVCPLLAEVPSTHRIGTAMCPEFLREGSGVADFAHPPFMVVGTGDLETAGTLRRLFGFLDAETHVVDVSVAEALKYACNAFHAAKITFANEMGRLFRGFGVDSRKVMQVFCQDTQLNVSPRYLRPGFAFGGSCLPKDLRSLLYMARMSGADLPMLAATLQSNELSVRDVVDRVLAQPGRTVALVGLSFKSDTDDLRESPYVELAETLLGKGYDVRVYDAIVNPARLVGANRRHLESRLPHVNRLLTLTPEQALDGADVALVSSADAGVRSALVSQPPAAVLDLVGGLGADVEALPGYQGVAW